MYFLGRNYFICSGWAICTHALHTVVKFAQTHVMNTVYVTAYYYHAFEYLFSRHLNTCYPHGIDCRLHPRGLAWLRFKFVWVRQAHDEMFCVPVKINDFGMIKSCMGLGVAKWMIEILDWKKQNSLRISTNSRLSRADVPNNCLHPRKNLFSHYLHFTPLYFLGVVFSGEMVWNGRPQGVIWVTSTWHASATSPESSTHAIL